MINDEDKENIYSQPDQFADQNCSRGETACSTDSQGPDQRLETSYQRALLFFSERRRLCADILKLARPHYAWQHGTFVFQREITMPAGMMFPVAYFASDYQPRRQFLLDSNPYQRIDLTDRIYFLCLGHLSRKTGKGSIYFLYGERLYAVGIVLSISK